MRRNLAVVLLAGMLNTFSLAHAEDSCRVLDPTGTPLNVRTTPNGHIVSTLVNGTLVSVLDRASDRGGKQWVYVGSSEGNKPIGWVYRNFIVCPATPTRVDGGPSFDLQFSQLPKEIRDHAVEVRKSCKELSGEDIKFDEMQGISVLDLKGDGSRDIVVDNEGLCGSHMAGANCSNRGCDVRIYKGTSTGQWRKIF